MCRTPEGNLALPFVKGTPVPTDPRTQELVHILAFHVEPTELHIMLHNMLVDENKTWYEFRAQMYEQQMGEAFTQLQFSEAVTYMLMLYAGHGMLQQIFDEVESMH